MALTKPLLSVAVNVNAQEGWGTTPLTLTFSFNKEEGHVQTTGNIMLQVFLAIYFPVCHHQLKWHKQWKWKNTTGIINVKVPSKRYLQSSHGVIHGTELWSKADQRFSSRNALTIKLSMKLAACLSFCNIPFLFPKCWMACIPFVSWPLSVSFNQYDTFACSWIISLMQFTMSTADAVMSLGSPPTAACRQKSHDAPQDSVSAPSLKYSTFFCSCG